MAAGLCACGEGEDGGVAEGGEGVGDTYVLSPLLQDRMQANGVAGGILVTVDAPVAGKREADERIAAEKVVSAISGAVAGNDKKGGGMGRLMAQYVEKRLVWEDVQWIKDVSGLPVVLKGVQSGMDARKAVECGCDGVMVSNHGGRSLDG